MITAICSVNRTLIFPDQEPAHDHGDPVGVEGPSNPPWSAPAHDHGTLPGSGPRANPGN